MLMEYQNVEVSAERKVSWQLTELFSLIKAFVGEVEMVEMLRNSVDLLLEEIFVRRDGSHSEGDQIASWISQRKLVGAQPSLNKPRMQEKARFKSAQVGIKAKPRQIWKINPCLSSTSSLHSQYKHETDRHDSIQRFDPASVEKFIVILDESFGYCEN